MKTATQTFIEDAIAGGWKATEYEICPNCYGSGGGEIPYHCQFCSGRGELHDRPDFDVMTGYPEPILLDPLAWQAVGKTRTWEKDIHDVPPASNRFGILYHNGMHMLNGIQVRREDWKWRMTLFIDHLCDGKTIQEALQAIQ